MPARAAPLAAEPPPRKPFAVLLAEIIEQGTAHQWDGGMRADMDRLGITAAGRRRMAEQLREQAAFLRDELAREEA